MERDRDDVYWLEKRLDDMVKVLNDLDARLVELERSQATFSVALSFARWAGPILVAVAAILIQRF